MTVKGKVTKVFPVQSGGAKSEWRKQSFIIETEGQYPKQVCIDLWGDKVNNPNVFVGSIIEAHVNPESREYNGYWYTDLRAWKIDIAVKGDDSVLPQDSQTTQITGKEDNSPF